MAKWLAIPFIYVGFVFGFIMQSLTVGSGAGYDTVEYIIDTMMEAKKNAKQERR